MTEPEKWNAAPFGAAFRWLWMMTLCLARFSGRQIHQRKQSLQRETCNAFS
jgi:hypothetical protein